MVYLNQIKKKKKKEILALDLNKDIQIINSCKNNRRKHEEIDNKLNPEFDNEKDIK